VNDLKTDSNVACKKRRFARGYRSMASLPVWWTDESPRYSYFTRRRPGFDDDELALLKHLA